MTEISCPYCGLVSRIPDGMPASCVGCGRQLHVNAPFAQDMQYAGQPVPQMQQPCGMQIPGMQTVQNAVPVQPVYHPEMLQQAKKKRRDWHILNGVLYAVQMAALGLGVTWDEHGFDTDMSVPLIGAWLASLVLFSIVSARLRPDAAYLEKPPFIRSKWAYGFFHFLISLTSFVSAAVVYAILVVLLN